MKTLLAIDAATFGNRKIILFYASRDSRSTIAKAQLDRWMATYPDRFECVYFFSREKNAAHARFRHLNNELLEQELRRFFGGRLNDRHRAQTHFYFCAPPAMMRMARMTLRQLDFPEENFHFEAFVPERVSTKRVPNTAHTHRIVAHWPSQQIDFQIFNGETILDGALRQGIALPYSCKAGVCLSCLARCVQGEVEVEFAQVTQLRKTGRSGEYLSGICRYGDRGDRLRLSGEVASSEAGGRGHLGAAVPRDDTPPYVGMSPPSTHSRILASMIASIACPSFQSYLRR